MSTVPTSGVPTSAVPMDPRLQARRIELLRQQGRRRLRVLVALVASTALVATGWWVVARSPLFTVDQVVIDGAERTPAAVIVEAAGIAIGEPLLEVDTNGAREAIAALPWVGSVTSDRTIGGEVRFTISERQPVAAVRGADGWLLVDAEGRVLDDRARVPKGVVAVEGARRQVRPGGWIGKRSLPALEVAALLPQGLRAQVAAIAEIDAGIELELVDGGRVLVGDTTELDDKFLAALTMVTRADLTCLDAIDVRAPTVPVLTRTDGCS